MSVYEDIAAGLKQAIAMAECNFQKQNYELDELKKEIHQSNLIIFHCLSAMIGHNIYWADRRWNKYETHTISKVSIEKQESDFFGAEYVGKECVRIYLSDGGYYIADKIGINLFFHEFEARNHTKEYTNR